jgi:hypothetical protein
MKRVKPVSLDTQVLREKGQLKAGQDLGYRFEGKAGQNLSFRTKEDICVWIYAPDNSLLTDGKLPINGKYIVQVGALKGGTSFGLDITLGDLSTASNPSNPSNPSTTPDSFTRQAALDLVDQWLEAKAKVFAPPFDVALASRLTTGRVYEDISKADGSVNWLRNNNAYYRYGKHKVSSTGNFSATASSAKIDVEINQPLSYYENNQLVKSETTSDIYQFTFQFENGSWKISDRAKK